MYKEAPGFRPGPRLYLLGFETVLVDAKRSFKLLPIRCGEQSLHQTPLHVCAVANKTLHMGSLQGKTRAGAAGKDAKGEDAKIWKAFQQSCNDDWRVPGGGESYNDVWDRSVGCLERLAREQPIAVRQYLVSHHAPHAPTPSHERHYGGQGESLVPP